MKIVKPTHSGSNYHQQFLNIRKIFNRTLFGRLASSEMSNWKTNCRTALAEEGLLWRSGLEYAITLYDLLVSHYLLAIHDMDSAVFQIWAVLGNH